MGPAAPISRQFWEVMPRVLRSVRAQTRSFARDEMSITHFRVLARLSAGECNNRQLAEEIGVSVPAMSRVVDSLARAGWVSRRTGRRDRREVRLSLTARGRTRFDGILGSAQKESAHQFAGLTPQKLESLRAGLEVLDELFGGRAT
jgi:DNA-binding MarR family transcriptional regulator